MFPLENGRLTKKHPWQMERIQLFTAACEDNVIFNSAIHGSGSMWEMAAWFLRVYSSAGVTTAMVSRSHDLCVASRVTRCENKWGSTRGARDERRWCFCMVGGFT